MNVYLLLVVSLLLYLGVVFSVLLVFADIIAFAQFIAGKLFRHNYRISDIITFVLVVLLAIVALVLKGVLC